MRKKYLSRLSGGFLDRIDIFTEMRSVKAKDLQDITGEYNREETDEDREAKRRIALAWEMQKKRYCWTEGITKVFNGTCERTDMNLFKFSPELSKFASEAAIGMGLSARGFKNLMRVARTIADMKGAEEITLPDVKQALMYKVSSDGI
jgi:magnesium chelatase family protein